MAPMHCRNIYCNSSRTLRYWHLNIIRSATSTRICIAKRAKIYTEHRFPFYVRRIANVTRRIYLYNPSTEFFLFTVIFVQYISTFSTNHSTIFTISRATDEKGYANDLLRVDHVTLLADLRVPRNKKGKRKLECNCALVSGLRKYFLVILFH